MSVEGVENLTPRQKEILRLLLAGFDAKSIASELGISVHTVTEHLREARRHLQVTNSREAARLLAQTEAGPPNNLGPNNIGVVGHPETSSSSQQSKPNRRLIYLGASIMILLVTMTIALALSDNQPGAQQNKSVVQEIPATSAEANPSPYPVLDVPVAKFDKLEVAGPIKVFVIQSDEASQVSLQGPRALISDAVVEVDDGTLTVRFREGARWSWNPGSGLNAVVRTPSLSSVRLEGAGSVEIFFLKGDTFAATTEGAGSVTAKDIDVGKVLLTTKGAGGITVGGTAQEASYSVGGAGSIDGMRLKVTEAQIAVAGAGSSYANVSGEAEISLTGAGSVEVVGGGVCQTKTGDPDRIDCR